MQQMNSEETQDQLRNSYGRYEGNTGTRIPRGDTPDQKLHVDDDEQFADQLARRIKAELRSEVQTRKDTTMGHRLALAIVSVCIILPLFITLVVALSLGLGTGGAGIALGWGFVAACAVIFAANAYFSWASIEIHKQQKLEEK